MADQSKDIRDTTDEQEELAQVIRDKDANSSDRSAARNKLNEVSKQAGEQRAKEIAQIKDPKEKQVVELYEKGVQNYAIAKEVYEFVNNDTVGRVIGIIRKHYANDYTEVEDINSYKGYTGI